MNKSIPHLRIVLAVSAFVLIGFAAVSAYVLVYTNDEVTKGNIIGTWQNFGMLAVGFWLGSSSGGKAKDDAPQSAQADAADVAHAAGQRADEIKGETP